MKWSRRTVVFWWTVPIRSGIFFWLLPVVVNVARNDEHLAWFDLLHGFSWHSSSGSGTNFLWGFITGGLVSLYALYDHRKRQRLQK